MATFEKVILGSAGSVYKLIVGKRRLLHFPFFLPFLDSF
ncbi:Hypothetical protein Minf_0225 [Methylacidiphilum infernorum V4]|uniref:Uncharacterized protein n=1 Tax=Methylacidiphilum infernorum (isolate V4) TaxID=481448 RepID=B3DXQ1_METI4|nr:Hypothetical protein Minf_0225 [Methylacidiphilum infernorum V4]